MKSIKGLAECVHPNLTMSTPFSNNIESIVYITRFRKHNHKQSISYCCCSIVGYPTQVMKQYILIANFLPWCTYIL